MSLDGQVARRDKKVSELLDKFVTVRIVEANSIDLALFQFDFELSWTVFFLNADRTLYGRYGSRSSIGGLKDISIEGFNKAMEGALELHKGFPANRAAVAGKAAPPAPKYRTPREYPSLSKYPATVATGQGGNCIHCHQIYAAEKQVAGAALPMKLHFPYPMPRILGLEMDTKEKARVSEVQEHSSAEKDGFKAGDDIVSLAGQAIISLADIQWILHNADETGALKAEVKRQGKWVPLTLTLAPGWRTKNDVSWRKHAK